MEVELFAHKRPIISDMVTTPMTFLDSLDSRIQTRCVSSFIITSMISFNVVSEVAVAGII
jgi:hypothetical protein